MLNTREFLRQFVSAPVHVVSPSRVCWCVLYSWVPIDHRPSADEFPHDDHCSWSWSFPLTWPSWNDPSYRLAWGREWCKSYDERDDPSVPCPWWCNRGHPFCGKGLGGKEPSEKGVEELVSCCYVIDAGRLTLSQKSSVNSNEGICHDIQCQMDDNSLLQVKKFFSSFHVVSGVCRSPSILTSIGSTSCAMTTSWAFFCSTNLVTEFAPARMIFPFLEGASSFPAAFDSAFAFKRFCLANFVSGRYFSNSLNNWTQFCLSKAWENWLIGGGIFKRFCRMALWRWMRMYLGHLTKRDKSRLGWMLFPT